MSMALEITAVKHGFARAHSVTEICPGAIFAVTGYLPASCPATWLMPGMDGVIGISCYVVRDGDQALIVDSGLSIHRDIIREGLGALLAGATTRQFAMTRREPDAIINLPFLVKEFDLGAVYCGGVLNPLDFFERVDQQSLESHVSAIAHASVDWAKPGSVLLVGALQVEVLRTSIVVLPKTHLYERRTGTLLGSDTWGFLSQTGTAALDSVTTWSERLSREAIARYLRHKFDWLCGIDTTPIVDDLLELRRKCDIQRICCSYGGIIEGESLSRRVLDETIEAVRMLGREPVVDRLRGFDHAAFKAAIGS